ncbi:MAG: DUF4867 family protein [Eubacteriales bacterium]
MLKKLKQLNEMEILEISDSKFKTYGKVLTALDVDALIAYMEANTEIPENGNIYIPSEEGMEQLEIYGAIQKSIYGGMDIQIGYCNGRNSTYNGFEYHKGSELNIAVTDLVMILGHSWDIEGNTYKNEDAEVFYVKKGTVFEMYQTTLHLSPCKVRDEGFKAVVVLPRGTNTPLEDKAVNTQEDQILLLKNKWIIAHKDREPLVKAGAHVGIIGENTEIKYAE